jgi:hypothetical protein
MWRELLPEAVAIGPRTPLQILPVDEVEHLQRDRSVALEVLDEVLQLGLRPERHGTLDVVPSLET